jgi:molybdate-binding protein/DNA-binding XRE family transcriptional regulator
VKAYRAARNWSQEELAQRTGLSRAGVSAIEIGRLVPSTAAALALARVFSCTVEDLFELETASDGSPDWAWEPRQDSCRYWLAEVRGRRWLYPAEMSQLGLTAHDGVRQAGQLRTSQTRDPSQTLVIATCDPAVGLLAAQMAEAGPFRLLVLQRSTREALGLLSRGLVHVAGLHLAQASDPVGNAPLVREVAGRGYQLLRIARWEEGVAYRPELRLTSLRAATRSPVRWVGRECGSAARRWLDELLPARRTPRRIARDHRGVADAIRGGWADAGVCHRLVSEEARLSFLRLPQEAYDLCYPGDLAGDPRLETLVKVVRSVDYRRQLAQLPGYAVTDAGEIQPVD